MMGKIDLKDIFGPENKPLQHDVKTKRWFKWLVAGVLAAVIILFDILTGWIQFSPAEDYGNTSGNLANMGMAAERDGWIYYSCNTFQDIGLYKVRTDGADKTKMNDAFAFNINIVGDWAYYTVTTIIDTESETSDTDNGFTETIKKTESESAVYKTHINGEGETIKIKDGATDIIVEGEWIYFIAEDSGSIGRICTDGTQETLIADVQADDISLMDGWIFFTDADEGDSLYKIRVDSSEKTLLDDRHINCIVTEGGWVYYTADKDDICPVIKMRADGSRKSDLNIYPFILFNIKDGWIYYSNTEDESSLYKARIDGTGKTKLSETPGLTINIAGDWIYHTLNHFKMKTDGTENQRME